MPTTALETAKIAHQAASDAVERACRRTLAAEYAFKVADYDRLLERTPATEARYDATQAEFEAAEAAQAAAFDALHAAARAVVQAR